METLDKTKQLGLSHAEAFFFQELGSPFPKDSYLNYDMNENDCTLLRQEFKKRGIELTALGVAFYGTNEEWDNFFAFAHKMGIALITAEPELHQLDHVESLAKKYNIHVAIHNHPAPSVYAYSNTLVKALEGRSPLIGVCADIGHWRRVGEDPLANLKKFEGRLKVVHLKDLSDQLEDATWGTGILPVKAVVKELKRQQFRGFIFVEYENFKADQVQDIEDSLKFLETCIE